MNRRAFLKTGVSAAIPLVLAPSSVLWSQRSGKIEGSFTILHTNDTHARIDPFPASNAKLAGLGGIARRAKAVREIRAEQKNVLLLDAGDVFQGTPYFNFYKGELDLELMTEMGYAATTIGNHEFDLGIDGFCSSAKKAGFPYVNSNYSFGNSPMKQFVQPYLIQQSGGLKVGIFGVGVKLEGLVLSSMCDGVSYQDPIEPAAKMVEYLRKTEKCDVVICLSHLGFEYPDETVSDKKLAEKVAGIDVIIGGHTHTFLDAPYVVDRDGVKTLVTQAGWGGAILGRLDVAFDGDGKIKTIARIPTPIDARFA